MTNKKSKLSFKNIMILYVIVYTITPIVQRFTSTFLTVYIYMAIVFGLTAMLLFGSKPEGKGNAGIFSFLLPFLLFRFLSIFLNTGDLFLWFYQYFLFILPIIIGNYLTDIGFRDTKLFRNFILLSMFVTMLTTIVGTIRYPNAARVLATVDSQNEQAILYDWNNIGGYSFVYFMVLLYPLLIFAYKRKKVKLLPTVIISLLIMVTTIFSEYTTALLFFILSSVLFFLRKDLTGRGIIIMIIFSVLILVFFSSFFNQILGFIASRIGSETISERLLALSGGIEGLEQFEDNRIELYRISLETFFRHPILGVFISKDGGTGGHSFIFDSMANYGVLGLTLIVVMYRKLFANYIRPYKDKPGYGFVVWFFFQCILLSVVNTGIWLEVICLFAPIMLHAIFENKEETHEERTMDSEYAAQRFRRENLRAKR